MKKGGYLKKKGDGGGWHAPMALPENPKTQSPMVGPMNKPMIGPTNAMRENQRVEQISPADALRKAQELNAINAKKASFQDLKKQQRQQLNKQKKGGAKKYEVGGMTEAASCAGPNKPPRCKKTFKSKGKSKETKGSILGTLGAIAGGLGGYAAYKKLKEQKKGGATKYEDGGSTNTTATEPPKSKKIKLNDLIIHTEGAKLAQRKAMKKMEDRRHKKQQTGGATKYKTGGMVNTNVKASVLKKAGTNGVKSGINPKAKASKVAKGRVGGISTAPKKATPGKK